ncbi:MAG: class I SAM-dependent methyltransferase [Solirubrobacteraceae bacterium]
MDDHEFEPIAASLREAMIEYYRVSGERLGAAAWHNTLETNSGYVERRAGPLLELYMQHSGRRSLRGVRVADLGCGFGALSLFFAAHGATVDGIDPNASRLAVGREVAARHRLPVTLRPARMQDLDDLEDAVYDLAIQNNSFCYIVGWDDRAQALRETHRVLRGGGLLISRNPNRLAPIDQFTGIPALNWLPPDAADRAAGLLGRHRSRVRMLTDRAARQELRRAGFDDVRTVVPFGSRWPRGLHRVAGYQHLVARRPAHGGPVPAAG